jgi:two-component system, chemotaxis family, chemotaxis protein CheY
VSSRPESELIAQLAHDLKNPIAVITGYAELLGIRDDEEIRREAPDRILEAAAQLSELIEGMLSGATEPVHGPTRSIPSLPAQQFWGEGSRAVVIADDDKLLRRLLRTALPPDGFTVYEADDGDAALQLVDAHNPVLLLLDLSMPRRSGVEVLAVLRTTHPQLPVIVVSAEPRVELRQQALALGAVEFIAKPFSPMRLLSTIHARLGESLPIGSSP